MVLVGRVFANGPADVGSIPSRVIPKTLKWYLIPPCLILSNIRYVSRVKWSNPGKGLSSPLHFGVVAIEKGALWSPSTTVPNFYIYIYIYVYIYKGFMVLTSYLGELMEDQMLQYC